MKLGLSINAFDATEHLETIIGQIREHVDYIIGVWQKKSYWGNPIDEVDYNELIRLKEKGLIDELMEFVPNLSLPAREEETKKRNNSIKRLMEVGCTHVLNIDADEYYDGEEFKNAKDYIIKNKILITYCTYINYYKNFDNYLVYPFKPYVPFIHHVKYNYLFNGPAPGPTDPTRRINNPYSISQEVLPDELIRMHHAAWIRKDIRKKLVNWSAKDFFPTELIDKAVERFNNWKEGEDAIMLFNVPNNSVFTKRLPKRLINIQIPFVDNI